MNQERIEASAITTAVPLAPFADDNHNRIVPRTPRDASRAARRLAVWAPTYYALKHGAVTRTAPLTRADAGVWLATARATHAIEIDLHS